MFYCRNETGTGEFSQYLRSEWMEVIQRNSGDARRSPLATKRLVIPLRPRVSAVKAVPKGSAKTEDSKNNEAFSYVAEIGRIGLSLTAEEAEPACSQYVILHCGCATSSGR